ncbi:MAG TPA: DUF4198 domain-containing protein [Ohtaekwangia sp.]|nr:DUF4198 domain-containing protein [Ohtaekwangia sp.]
MIRSCIIAVLIVGCLAITTDVVNAQELWLRPDKYFYEPGEQAVIEIQRGEDFIGNPFPLKKTDIRLLENWNAQGSQNLLTGYERNEKAVFTCKLDNEGYQFIFFRAPQSYEIEAESFNEYLKQYGHDRYYADRERKGNLDKDVKIALQHHIQLTLRSGSASAKGWNKPRKLPIEIIPDKNPQTLRRGDRIHFKVLENGEPAFGVRVKIWNRWDNRTTIQNIYTEKDGTISTTISNPGDWMVTVVMLSTSSGENDYVGDVFCLLFGYR